MSTGPGGGRSTGPGGGLSTGPGGGLSTGPLGLTVDYPQDPEEACLRGLAEGYRPVRAEVSLPGRSRTGAISRRQPCSSSTWPTMGCCTLLSTWPPTATLRRASI